MISRLVRSTTPQSTFSEFPDGSSVFIGGFDGMVKCKEDTPYVPQGTSLWEFGTQATVSGKAEEDIAKRTKDSLGYDPSECTLIIVTPRFFKKKDDLRKEKLKLNVWKDIRVYDSRNLEEWFGDAEAPSRWFSSYIKKYPSDGIITIEEFWKEWSIGPNGQLSPSSVTTGREYASQQLASFLKGDPGIKAIKASSKDEAIAFIIASAMQFEKESKEIFESKSLVIETSASFRGVRINRFGLNLIARFEDSRVLYAGVSDGHHVLVPLGPDDDFNQEIITLPLLDRDGLASSLKSMGLSETKAKRFVLESARNITVLKRLLEFPQYRIEWAEEENARDIIPGLLLGRWDESKKGDLELLEKLAGDSYENYVAKISKWKNHPAPPFLQIGETWRLTSPLDAWANLAPFIRQDDLQLLRDCFFEGYKYGNPYIKNDDRLMPFAGLFSNERKFSFWAREGLIQSLILIGLYGKGIRIPGMESPQEWVDEIVEELFSNADGDLWVSLDKEMPLIGEASPSSFFEAVFSSLSDPARPIMKMFVEKEGLLHTYSHHTGLLWALEELAWDTEYLEDSTLALSMLARLDPGGSVVNRPINSLAEIFKPWHYQTLASLDQRMEVIKEIALSENEIGWKLLLRLLPEHVGVASPTHIMRWRMFDRTFDRNYTYQEVWETHSRVVDMLISFFDGSEEKLTDITDLIDKISPKDRNTVFDFISTIVTEVNQTKFSSWHSIRRTLSHYRSYPNRESNLSRLDIEKLETIYHRLQPEDVINRYRWLFDENWPSLPEGNPFDEEVENSRHDQHQQKIENRRIEGLGRIVKEKGFKSVIALSNEVSEGWTLGDTLGRIIESKEDSELVIKALISESQNTQTFVQSFLGRKSIKEGEDWIFEVFNEFETVDSFPLSKLLIPTVQNKRLFDFLDQKEEIKEQYWLEMQPRFYHLSMDEKIRGVQELINHGRYFSAIKECYYHSRDIPSNLIVDSLEKAATLKSVEQYQSQSYEIGKLLESLEERNDIPREKFIQLEWLYISYLSSYGSSRNPKALHEELGKNPKFYVDILKWVYMPKNKDLVEKEREGLSDEIIRNRGEYAYGLINSWKVVPGTKEEGGIDGDYLRSWVDEVRALSKEADRSEVADSYIGKILAQYPEKDFDWPPNEIAEIIESINTVSLKSGFSSATFNKRGSSSRGPFDGGDIERGHAKYFNDLAKKHKRKHPNVSKIFSKLAAGYLRDAKRMDEEAERSKLDY